LNSNINKQIPIASNAAQNIKPVPCGNPMAAVMSGIADAAAKLRKNRTRKKINATALNGSFAQERDIYVQKMSAKVDAAGRCIENLFDQINEAKVQCRTLREYFGENISVVESHRIFSTLKTFMDLLAQSKRTYEKLYGRVVVVKNERRSSSFSDDCFSGEKVFETRMWAVESHVATRFGPGIVEALRVREHVYMVRLNWGVAFLRQDSIIDVNCTVRTPYGHGRVVAIENHHEGQQTKTFYQVDLIWGYVLLRPKSIFSIHQIESDDTASLSFPDDEDSDELRLSFDNS
jgi:hypothetical protein